MNRITKILLFIRIYTSPRLYKYDHYFDKSLLESLDSGIKYLKYEHLTLDIEFNNGSRFNLWNANRYYAWLRHSKLNEKQVHGVPSRKAMYKLVLQLYDYDLENKIILDGLIKLIQVGDQIKLKSIYFNDYGLIKKVNEHTIDVEYPDVLSTNRVNKVKSFNKKSLYLSRELELALVINRRLN